VLLRREGRLVAREGNGGGLRGKGESEGEGVRRERHVLTGGRRGAATAKGRGSR
jgi:hypothetical protein